MKTKQIPINIKVKDLKIYTIIAYLLDYDKLYKDILSTRSLWKLDELIPYEDFDNWRNDTTLHYEFKLSNDAYYVLQEAERKLETDKLYYPDKKNINEREEILAYLDLIDLEIKLLINKNQLRSNFSTIIHKAIVCGEVRETDYSTNEMDDSLYRKLSSDSYFKNDYIPLKELNKKPEIKNHREWYWLKKEGLTSLEIATIANKSTKIDPHESESQIKKAIKNYSKFLSRDK